MLSPAPGAELRAGWVPVVVQVPLSWLGSDFSLTLDGQPLDDPLAELRRRKNSESERGAQLLATLPLGDLAAGEHLLEARFERPWWPDSALSSRFTVHPRAHRLGLRVSDGQGRPVNARVELLDAEGPLAALDDAARNSDRKQRDAGLSAVMVRDGVGSVRLDPGRYRVVAHRGLRYGVAVADVELHGDAELDLALPLVVDTPGRVAADLHVHTASSYDVFTPHAARMDALACTGLEVVGLADHNRIARPEALQAYLAGEAATPWLVPGIEADLRGREARGWDWGHLTVWPVVAGDDQPSKWPGSPANAIADWRGHQAAYPHPVTGEDLFFTLAHPRGIQFRADKKSQGGAWALFNNQGFDRDVPVGEGSNAWMLEPSYAGVATILDVDALELVNRMSLDRYREVRLDWFALANQGYRITGMGNSDSHALAVELVGMPRNLITGGVDAAGELDLPGLIEASREGRVSVTTGPVLDLELRTATGRAGLGETLSSGGEPVEAVIRVRAAPWVPVHELRLVRNGRVIHVVRLPGTVQDDGPAFEHTEVVALDILEDAWLLAEAGWPADAPHGEVGGTYGIVAPGYVPFAFTNPVYVDADGDGGWTPPGLPGDRSATDGR